MSCGCDQQNNLEVGDGLNFAQIQRLASNDSSLHWFVIGVRTGMQIHAAEQAKWQKLGIILAVTFGAMTFLKHFGE